MNPRQKKKWIGIAIALLALIAVSLMCGNLSKFSEIGSDFLGIMSSVLFGIVFAYLMNPVMVVVERGLYKFLSKRNISDRAAKKISRGIGIVVALIVFIASVYALIVLIVPQFVDSVEKLVSTENLNLYKDKLDKWISKMVANTRLEQAYAENSDRIFEKIQNWISTKLLNESWLLDAIQQVYGAVKQVINALIGIIMAIYMLAYKDTLLAQSKKIVVATFKPERANRIIDTAHRSNKIVSGFLIGKLIDSIIVGILCYIGMRIMKMPYPALISVLIGVTNIIPFFGPLLGLIPSALIILVEDPLTAFYFVIFILALQQLDGNVIGPRILGDRVGISDFWILVSLTVFSGLFGFVGMLIGVPVFSVIYMLLSDAVNRSLERKNRPLDTGAYYDISSVDDLHTEQKNSSAAEEETPQYDTEFDPDDDLEIEETDDD
jgi:predicted PurR-regulated permease PerM